jgi:hypothetical protein
MLETLPGIVESAPAVLDAFKQNAITWLALGGATGVIAGRLLGKIVPRADDPVTYAPSHPSQHRSRHRVADRRHDF